jgi:hypothetical protein
VLVGLNAPSRKKDEAFMQREHGSRTRRCSLESAKPGEVLVSSTVKDLVAGSGIRFADRGTHGLKGVPGEWGLFAVQ